MNGANFILLFGLLTVLNISAQNTSLSGIVVDASSFEKISGTDIIIEGTTFQTSSDSDGIFNFSENNLPEGNQILVFSKPGFTILRLPVILTVGETKNLDLVPLQLDIFREQLQTRIISLSDNELNEDQSSIDNVSGLLHASRDVFLNVAAFDFSQTLG